MGRKSRGCFSFLSAEHAPASVLPLALLAPLLLGAALLGPTDRFLRVAVEVGGRQDTAMSRRNEIGEKDVIVQAFQMSWNSVARECEDVLGPAGFGFVQRFEHYIYPGIYNPEDFHQCRPNGDNSIQTYQSRFEVQNCELLALADLATEKPYVIARLGGYLNDLVSLGVDGFRVDSAKHVSSDDISKILQQVRGDAFVVQEVPFGAGEPIHVSQEQGRTLLVRR
ncbi:hypothetical protein RQP46_007663 [Phenoliferia psychrophenolica]